VRRQAKRDARFSLVCLQISGLGLSSKAASLAAADSFTPILFDVLLEER